MKRILILIIIFIISIQTLNAARLSREQLVKRAQIKRIIKNGDNKFIRKKFEEAKKLYEKALSQILKDKIKVGRKTLYILRRDIQSIKRIADFNSIEKVLKQANAYFSENKTVKGIKELKKVLKIINDNEDLLSSYKNISFIKKSGYKTFLVRRKLLELRRGGGLKYYVTKKNLVVLDLKNTSNNQEFGYFSAALPRSITNVLNKTGGYKVFYHDDFRNKIKDFKQKRILNFFKRRKVELVVFGEYDITVSKEITLTLKVYDSYTGNNVANAIVVGKASSKIFEAIDIISSKLDKYLVEYSRENFFQTLVVKLTGTNDITTTRIVHSQNNFNYDKFVKELKKTIKDKWLTVLAAQRQLTAKKWKSNIHSEEYVSEAHKLVILEDQYEDEYDDRPEFFLKQDKNEVNLYETYKKLVRIDEIEKAITEREYETADKLFEHADNTIDRLKHKYPKFSKFATSVRIDYNGLKASYRRARGLRFEFVIKAGFPIFTGEYKDKVNGWLPTMGLEFRMPLAYISNWFQLNLGFESFFYAIKSKAMESAAPWNPAVTEKNNVFKMYHIPIIANLFLRFKPLKWLDVSLVFGFGISINKIEALQARADTKPLWEDKTKVTYVLKAGLDLQFRFSRVISLDIQFTFMHFGKPDFYTEKFDGGSDADVEKIYDGLVHGSYNIFTLTGGIAIAF